MEKSPTVLLISSDASDVKKMQKGLTEERYTVVPVPSSSMAKVMLQDPTFKPSVLLLDREEFNYPTQTALRISELHSLYPKLPIIVRGNKERFGFRKDTEDTEDLSLTLSDRGEFSTILGAGAENYRSIEDSPSVIGSTIRAVLRRLEPFPPEPALVIEMDYKKRRFFNEGKEVTLTNSDYRLYKQFDKHPGKILPARFLLTETWGAGYADDIKFLRVRISRLRHAFGDSGEKPKIFLNYHGIGYLLEDPQKPRVSIEEANEYLNSSQLEVLVISQDKAFRKILKLELPKRGMVMHIREKLQEIEEHLLANRADLVILDQDNPLLNIADIHSIRQIPVIAFSSKQSDYATTQALDEGAAYYISKPFSHVELIKGYIPAALRRSHQEKKTTLENKVTLGNLEIDFKGRWVKKEGELVHLRRNEWLLLQILASKGGGFISSSELLTMVWGSKYRDNTAYLRQWIYKLRKKIKDGPENPQFILTAPGRGYMLNSPQKKPLAKVI